MQTAYLGQYSKVDIFTLIRYIITLYINKEIKKIMYDFFLKNILPVIEVIVLAIAAFLAWSIGKKQNRINSQIGKIQDSVELYATFAVKKIIDQEGKEKSSIPVVHIQNVGTRHLYFDRYIFNGRIYELNGQVRPPTYSQAENNFYIIELPTNKEDHVSLEIEYRDIDDRKWKTLILANLKNGFWEIETYPRKLK